MAEYEKIQLEGFKEKAGDCFNEEIEKVLKNIIHFHGLDIDVVGSWVWVAGNTFLYKEQLKELGFKWSPNRKKMVLWREKRKRNIQGRL